MCRGRGDVIDTRSVDTGVNSALTREQKRFVICGGDKGDNALVVRKKMRQSLVVIGISIQQGRIYKRMRG